MRVFDNQEPILAGVVLDLDGTLYPRDVFADAILRLVRQAFVDVQGRLPSDADRLTEALRKAMVESWADTSVTEFVLGHGLSADEWKAYRDEHFDLTDLLAPDPHVSKALGQLAARTRLALLSNSSRLSGLRTLQALGIDPSSFHHVIFADRTLPFSKPHAAAFEVALESLDVPPKYAWGIGDRYAIDVDPLRALGGSGIEVTGPEELPDAITYLLDHRFSVAAEI